MSYLLNIFLAEDNPADVYLIREALIAARLDFDLHRWADGEEALRALAQIEESNQPVSLILLDLNLPKVSGHELLAHVRGSAQLRSTPVIVLTSSDSPEDRAQTSALQISHYFRKPTDFTEFLELGVIVERVCKDAHKRSSEQSAHS